MKFILKILKFKPLWFMTGFLLLLVLIFIGGARLEFPPKSQLLCLVVVLLVLLLLLWVKQMKANRRAALLEQSIRTQAETEMFSLETGKKAEIEELKKELLTAIDSLKKSKLGHKGGGRAALYALPWYLFVGPPAAGKTTAIMNSGLEFSFGKDIKGIGGTRNCDWFFSNSAILLDTAGRYMTEDEDREEWWAFLDILKKYRKRKPINGVIVGISIADIMTAKAEEIEAHAKNLRRRIDELIQRLGVRFPVYVVFTKCDLVQGFVEFFENMSRREREQIWGYTLPAKAKTGVNPGETFEQEFQVLVKAIDGVRLKRLESGTKPEIRSRVFTFPLQFSAIKENIGFFIEKLFQLNMYKEAPIFRGLYFTSGTQEGVPMDLVIQAIAKQFGLKAELGREPEIQKKSYFIKRVFTDVIIPDQYLGTRTWKASIHRSVSRTGLIAGLAIFLGLLILGVSQAYVRGKMHLKSLQEAAASLQTVRWDRTASPAENFKSLERFRYQTARIENFKTFFPLLLSGFSWRTEVLPPAYELHFRKIRPFVEAYLYLPLENQLRDFQNGMSSSSEQAYGDLRTYLLLGSEKSQLDANHQKIVVDFLTKILERSYSKIVPNDETGEIRPWAGRQIEHFVRCLALPALPPFDNDNSLVKTVRRLIIENQQQGISVVYSRLKNKGLERLTHPLSLSQVLAGSGQNILSSDEEVPEFFTKQGWEKYASAAIEQESLNPSKIDWILGQTEKEIPPEILDPKKMAGELQSLYFQDYAETWRLFCRSVRYRPLDGLDAISALMKKLSDGENSPIYILLKSVDEQTQLAGEDKGLSEKVLEAVTKIEKKIGAADKEESEGAVPPKPSRLKQFEKLHDLFSADKKQGGGSAGLESILAKYAAIGEAIDSLVMDSGPKIKEASVKVISQEAGELPEALKTIRRSITENSFDVEARRAIFEQPIQIAWAAILGETQKNLDASWRKKVYEPFQMMLANCYPFHPQGKDASIQDIKLFFDPQAGILWGFISNELTPYLELESLSAKTWEGAGLMFSPRFLDTMRRAKDIREALFSQAGFKVSFSMQPELYEKVSGFIPIIDQISLVIDGTTDQYRMGGVHATDFSWPGEKGPPGAGLYVSSKGNFEPLKCTGEWGWFRLLALATVDVVTPKEYKVSWLFTIKDGSQVRIPYRLLARSSVNPFREGRRFFDFACAERLN